MSEIKNGRQRIVRHRPFFFAGVAQWLLHPAVNRRSFHLVTFDGA